MVSLRSPTLFFSCLSFITVFLLIEANDNTNSKPPTPKKFLAANWKNALQTPTTIDTLVDDLNHLYSTTLTPHQTSTVQLCVNPPHVFLDRVRQRLHPSIAVGAQNLYDSTGPNRDNTGSVTPTALAGLGVTYVLLGHSDRRNGLGEDDRLIADKVRLALEAGLEVILTIGELGWQRRFGLALRTLRKQLAAAAKSIPGDGGWDKIIVAYEPVWSVGEGATPCSPSEAQRVNAFLRRWVRKNVGERAAESVRLTYTGSVNEGNAESYAGLEDVDGFVVGRAGLDARRLGAIVGTLAASVAGKEQ